MMFTKTRYFNKCFVNTIEKDETYHGHWWLPQTPTNKVGGVLRLYKKGGVRLHLIGMFSDDASEIFGHDFVDHDIILGELAPGNGAVTLIGCKERERESPYLSNTTEGAVQRFKIEKALFFQHFSSLEALKFKCFEFSTTYLAEWVNDKRVLAEFKGEKTTIQLMSKSELIVNAQDCQIAFTSWANTNLEYRIDQNTTIFLKFNVGITLEEFEENYRNPLLDLIQFSTSFLNSMTFLNVYSEENGLRKIISTSEFDRVEKQGEPVHHYFLFHLSDLENNWNSFILNWLNFHNDSKHIFRLYFDSILVSSQFPVTKFLNIIQAVESYHREKEKNDVSLKTRLIELLVEAENIFSRIVKSQDTFISKIRDTRNYYTHYSSDKKMKAATGLELLALTEALRMLLNFHICIACGIGKDKTQNLIIDNHLFTYVEQLVAENALWGATESNHNSDKQ